MTSGEEARAIAREILGDCTCSEAHKSRRLTEPGCAWHEYGPEVTAALLSAESRGRPQWQPIETAPLGQMVLLWAPCWRHPFPGQRNGDLGQCWVDTCEPKAAGWQAHCTHWLPLSSPEEG